MGLVVFPGEEGVHREVAAPGGPLLVLLGTTGSDESAGCVHRRISSIRRSTMLVVRGRRRYSGGSASTALASSNPVSSTSTEASASPSKASIVATGASRARAGAEAVSIESSRSCIRSRSGGGVWSITFRRKWA